MEQSIQNCEEVTRWRWVYRSKNDFHAAPRQKQCKNARPEKRQRTDLGGRKSRSRTVQLSHWEQNQSICGPEVRRCHPFALRRLCHDHNIRYGNTLLRLSSVSSPSPFLGCFCLWSCSRSHSLSGSVVVSWFRFHSDGQQSWSSASRIRGFHRLAPAEATLTPSQPFSALVGFARR